MEQTIRNVVQQNIIHFMKVYGSQNGDILDGANANGTCEYTVICLQLYVKAFLTKLEAIISAM